jgi:hypothetical protein
MAVNEDKKLSDYELKTLRELQQSSNTAYVPAFTETENYKFDSKELNGQVLQAGTNVTIDNNNVIRATDTKLKSSDNISVTSDNKLVYTGPQGEGTDLEEDSTNLSIGRQSDGKYKVNLNLGYGSEVAQVHSGATTYNCTSTFFTSSDGGKSIKGNFAGFVNNAITFGRDPNEGNVPNSNLNLVISEDISVQYWNGGSTDRWILATPDDVLSFKKVNGTYPPYASRVRGDYYSQLIFNMPNIAALTLHTWWLQHVTHRENIFVQVNMGERMHALYIFNGIGDDNEGANFYFYHNGLVYKKENVSKGTFVNIANIVNWKLYTDLSGYGIENGAGNSRLVNSLPFTTNTRGDGQDEWLICTVQRFYCIHETVNNKHNYYFIESMY